MRREYIPLATLEFAGALNLVHGVWRPLLGLAALPARALRGDTCPTHLAPQAGASRHRDEQSGLMIRFRVVDLSKVGSGGSASILSR